MTARGPQMDADRLMALLYGELDEGDADRARAEASSSPEQAAELEGFERVRSLFRELPDEEPPARISAQLLAEAARSAPAQAQRKAVAAAQREDGFWARLVSWLSPVQHPGLAAAASLVLVAGVAGVLYLRKGEDMTKAGKAPAATARTETATGAGTPTPSEAPPPVAAQPPAADPAAEVNEADRESIESWAEGAADRARGDDAKLGSKGGKAPARKNALDDLDQGMLEKKKREAKPAASPKKPDTLRGGTVYGLSEQEMMPGDVAGGAGGGAPAANQAAPSPEPSPAPPQASTAPAGPSTKAPASKARPLSPAELHARAVDAALDKRCSDVRDLGSQIQAIDLGYYKKFRADPRLKACLETPSQYPARK